ncbi:prepilin-type N-terminal cleavage/methylation domain-containing protein, partial [Roseateles sp.]|uniref:prepilin-type N-terminal cleavage/methylation domain-containing protein n=1 Tax=Roseateles sp. TaxID=1971397 RepID=UPI0037CB3599
MSVLERPLTTFGEVRHERADKRGWHDPCIQGGCPHPQPLFRSTDMSIKKRAQQGFTLIELMIVV